MEIILYVNEDTNFGQCIERFWLLSHQADTAEMFSLSFKVSANPQDSDDSPIHFPVQNFYLPIQKYSDKGINENIGLLSMNQLLLTAQNSNGDSLKYDKILMFEALLISNRCPNHVMDEYLYLTYRISVSVDFMGRFPMLGSVDRRLNFYKE